MPSQVSGVEPNAFAAIPEMTKVDGIDMLCIGPRDLSASIAKMSQFDDPEFKELIVEAERRIVEGGKWLGDGTLPGITPADMFARGYHFVSNASDLLLLRGAAAQAAAAR
jgi:2-keto-3-deoxy-L-rhamnonate aldolase RhmA